LGLLEDQIPAFIFPILDCHWFR